MNVMKNQVTFLITFLLLLSPLFLSAQEKSTGEQKKAEQEILIKKMNEEEKARAAERENQVRIIREGRALRSEEIEKAMDEAREAYNLAYDHNGNFFLQEATLPGYFKVGSDNSTSVEYSRRLKESTMSKDFKFEIEQDAKRASVSVSGSCEVGEIRIQIMMPNGKEYTEVLIDKYGSVNWNKTFTLEDPKDEKIGTWKFIINTRDASGIFKIALRSS